MPIAFPTMYILYLLRLTTFPLTLTHLLEAKAVNNKHPSEYRGQSNASAGNSAADSWTLSFVRGQ